MAKFKCKKCKCEKELKKQTLIFENKKIKIKEAKCKCGFYMKDVTKYDGFGTSFKSETDKYGEG
jgi:hypothetical protein